MSVISACTSKYEADNFIVPLSSCRQGQTEDIKRLAQNVKSEFEKVEREVEGKISRSRRKRASTPKKVEKDFEKKLDFQCEGKPGCVSTSLQLSSALLLRGVSSIVDYTLQMLLLTAFLSREGVSLKGSL